MKDASLKEEGALITFSFKVGAVSAFTQGLASFGSLNKQVR
jgi:hypothetical protein